MFLTDPGLVPVPGKPDLWWLDGPLVWADQDVTITVPQGFISDDASVPKVLDWIPFLDRQGLSRRPGLAHDALYSLGRTRGKAYADSMLRAFCLAEGMNAFQAGVYYQGVHLFGASSWAADARAGSFGVVGSGDFISLFAYQAWIAGGHTIFGPPKPP
jgi:hypothetical protein